MGFEELGDSTEESIAIVARMPTLISGRSLLFISSSFNILSNIFAATSLEKNSNLYDFDCNNEFGAVNKENSGDTKFALNSFIAFAKEEERQSLGYINYQFSHRTGIRIRNATRLPWLKRKNQIEKLVSILTDLIVKRRRRQKR